MQDAASRITPCLIADHGSASAFRTGQCESSHEVEIANRNFGLPFHFIKKPVRTY